MDAVVAGGEREGAAVDLDVAVGVDGVVGGVDGEGTTVTNTPPSALRALALSESEVSVDRRPGDGGRGLIPLAAGIAEVTRMRGRSRSATGEKGEVAAATDRVVCAWMPSVPAVMSIAPPSMEM